MSLVAARGGGLGGGFFFWGGFRISAPCCAQRSQVPAHPGSSHDQHTEEQAAPPSRLYACAKLPRAAMSEPFRSTSLRQTTNPAPAIAGGMLGTARPRSRWSRTSPKPFPTGNSTFKEVLVPATRDRTRRRSPAPLQANGSGADTGTTSGPGRRLSRPFFKAGKIAKTSTWKMAQRIGKFFYHTIVRAKESRLVGPSS